MPFLIAFIAILFGRLVNPIFISSVPYDKEWNELEAKEEYY
jgi:hypothetical protein